MGPSENTPKLPLLEHDRIYLQSERVVVLEGWAEYGGES